MPVSSLNHNTLLTVHVSVTLREDRCRALHHTKDPCKLFSIYLKILSSLTLALRDVMHPRTEITSRAVTHELARPPQRHSPLLWKCPFVCLIASCSALSTTATFSSFVLITHYTTISFIIITIIVNIVIITAFIGVVIVTVVVLRWITNFSISRLQFLSFLVPCLLVFP